MYVHIHTRAYYVRVELLKMASFPRLKKVERKNLSENVSDNYKLGGVCFTLAPKPHSWAIAPGAGVNMDYL